MEKTIVLSSEAHNLTSAHKSLEYKDVNVLCLGQWLNDEPTNLEIKKENPCCSFP